MRKLLPIALALSLTSGCYTAIGASIGKGTAPKHGSALPSIIRGALVGLCIDSFILMTYEYGL